MFTENSDEGYNLRTLPENEWLLLLGYRGHRLVHLPSIAAAHPETGTITVVRWRADTGLIAVGTSEGAINVSKDGGHWSKVESSGGYRIVVSADERLLAQQLLDWTACSRIETLRYDGSSRGRKDMTCWEDQAPLSAGARILGWERPCLCQQDQRTQQTPTVTINAQYTGKGSCLNGRIHRLRAAPTIEWRSTSSFSVDEDRRPQLDQP